MKTVFFAVAFSMFSMSSMSFAAATCPQQSDNAMVCKSTPQAGDEEVAVGVLDSIAICGQGSKTVLVLEKDGESEVAEAKVDNRAGGSSYTVSTPDVDFSISVTGAIRGNTLPAKFTINIKSNNIVASSTYTCKR